MSAALWATAGLLYVLAAIYLQVFDDEYHPLWVWTPFYCVGSAILLLINRSFFLPPDGSASQAVEYIALLLVIGAGATLFWLVNDYARHRRELLEYQQLVDEREHERQERERER